MSMIKGRVHPIRIDRTLVLLMNNNESFSKLSPISVDNGELISLKLVLPDEKHLQLLEHQKNLKVSQYYPPIYYLQVQL